MTNFSGDRIMFGKTLHNYGGGSCKDFELLMPVELSCEKCVAACADDEVVVVGVRPPLRKYMAEGDFFIGAALATSLTKLCLRFIALTDDTKRQNVSLVNSVYASLPSQTTSSGRM